MSKRRVTIEILAAGQPRAYADTIHRRRILYEWQGLEGFKDKNAPFVRLDLTHREIVEGDAMHYGGWVPEGEGDWASTRLKYLKMIEPGLWEWETVSPFTD